MQASISLNDVIESNEKFGCVLDVDLSKVRDLKKLNPQSKYDTSYIPLVFKHVNGKTMKVKVKIMEQIIASGAKAPQSADSKETPKHLQISLMKMARSEIEGGDYVPKEKKDAELQEIENKRVSNNIDRYIDNNEKLIKVLDILDESYKQVCDDLKKNKSLDFRLKKDRKQTDITVWSIKQSTRLIKETDEEVPLENPIYRIKLPVCNKNSKIGIWSNYHNQFKPTVFDTRKMTAKNKYQSVPARVKVGGKLRDLDVSNASSFITYKSLIGGTISFECIVASKFGLSLSNSFYDLYVFRHKSKVVQITLTDAEIIAMRGGCGEEDDESDAELDESESKSNNNDDDDDDDDEEDDDDDDDEDDDDDDDDDEDEDEDEDEYESKSKK